MTRCLRSAFGVGVGVGEQAGSQLLAGPWRGRSDGPGVIARGGVQQARLQMQASLTLDTIDVAVLDVLDDPLVRAGTDQPLLRLREGTGLVRITYPHLLPTPPQRLHPAAHPLQRLLPPPPPHP